MSKKHWFFSGALVSIVLFSLLASFLPGSIAKAWSNDRTQITANTAVNVDAAVGVRNVSITTSGGTVTLNNASYPAWDVNHDGKVDYKDLAILGAHYGETPAPPYPAWDINQDGKVDYKDLAMLGAHYGETYTAHCGTISSDQTWRAADNPHIVTCDVYVEATLTLEPGVLVRFSSGTGLAIGYNNPGALVAVGTAGSPITFTSAQPSPIGGDWKGIEFWDSTVDGTTVLDHCVIEYGTSYPWGGWAYGSIYCYQSSPSITNCIIRQSGGYGVFSEGAGFTDFSNNTVTSSANYPLRIDAENVRTIGAGNSFTGNTKNGIEVGDGVIETTATWGNYGVPYVITGDLDVGRASNPVLTIAPGTTLRFRAGVGIRVGFCFEGGTGGLVADGTAGSPITFTSDVSPASPGDWYGIYFSLYTITESAVLDHCVIEYGTSYPWSGWVYGSIYCFQSSPSITNCTIRQSGGYGVYSQEAGFTVFSNNTITSSANYPLRIDSENVRTLGAVNSFTGNTKNGIEVEGGSIETSATWGNYGVPYVITSHKEIPSLDIGGTANPVLTIAPGTTLRFRPGVGINVGYCFEGSTGGLVAVGTADSPITFTSDVSPASPGDWYGIYFSLYTITESAVLDHCVIEYGTSYPWSGWVYGSIYCFQSSPSITNCTIRQSGGYGVYSQEAGFTDFSNNTVTSSANYPLRINAEDVRTLGTGNSLGGNTKNGIEVEGGVIKTSGIWLNQGVPYVITGDLDVFGPNGPVLTIAPGTTLRFRPSVGINVGDCFEGDTGGLVAVGIPIISPVTFTSDVSPASPGDWNGINFARYTKGASLMYCVIEYGGLYANIYCFASAPSISNCTIRQSSNWGIYVSCDSQAKISDNIYEDNASGDEYHEPPP